MEDGNGEEEAEDDAESLDDGNGSGVFQLQRQGDKELVKAVAEC